MFLWDGKFGEPTQDTEEQAEVEVWNEGEND